MIKFALALGLVSSSLCVPSFAEGNDTSAANAAVMIEINGKKLTFNEIEKERPGVFFHAVNTFYQGEQKALDQFVEDYLLDEQAKKEGLTVDQLFDLHVNKTIDTKEPPEEALHLFYEGVDTQQPYEAVRDQIIASIKQRRIAKARAAYIESVKKNAKIAIHLAPPRAQIDLKGSDIRGPQDAKVTLVEYADFECPYCQQIQPTLEKLETEYKGRLAFVYKDVPLPMHSHAQKAAEASHCAGEQGKYWEYHDRLYLTRRLEIADLKEHARTLKLDGEAFDKCLDTGKYFDQVRNSLNEGQRLGIEGTPSFFMNGAFFSGGLAYDQLKSMVDQELAAGAPKEVAKQ